jgi:hypothetical protein
VPPFPACTPPLAFCVILSSFFAARFERNLPECAAKRDGETRPSTCARTYRLCADGILFCQESCSPVGRGRWTWRRCHKQSHIHDTSSKCICRSTSHVRLHEPPPNKLVLRGDDDCGSHTPPHRVHAHQLCPGVRRHRAGSKPFTGEKESSELKTTLLTLPSKYERWQRLFQLAVQHLCQL